MSARLPTGGRIDRGRELRFRFNGREFTGHPGDTLASALLAHGVRPVARSFKYHRPRGIVAAGVEEPNALVQLFDGARSVPNARMTEIELVDGLSARSVNASPSVAFDLRAANGWFARLMPAGFYYKTFMASQRAWHFFERHIRAASGLGESPRAADPDHYEKRHAHCDVLIVGAGAAGLSAALAAGASGARVIVCDEGSEPGGWLLAGDETIDGQPAPAWVAASLARLASMPEVTLLARTTAFGFHDHGLVTLLERRADHLPRALAPAFRERLWKVRAARVVLATGAHERPLVFARNDLPGILLAGAVSTYVRRYAVLPGRDVLVFTNNDAGVDAALALWASGAGVRIIDARAQPDGALTARAREEGIPILSGHAIVEAVGRRRVRAARVAALDEHGRLSGRVRTLQCDLIAMSGGASPVIHLHAQAGGKARWDDALAAFVPGEPAQGERSAGACAGARTLVEAMQQGQHAGSEAAYEASAHHRHDGSPATAADSESHASLPATGDAARSPTRDGGDGPAIAPADPGTIRPLWLVPHPAGPTRAPKQFVDLQNDVAASDLLLAVREGFESIEHVKRYTAMGFGTDQGKTGNINGMGIVAQALGKTIAQVGTTTFRPNYTPVSFGAVAGVELGEAFDPVRTTSLHDWHVASGAHFEDVGQWKRPWFYPRRNEDMPAAVRREVLAVRNGVGLLDASTLGKIDIQGPDAAALLDWVYCNGFSTLGIGRARYGLMLDENGMVFDDGVTVRLAEHHYLMHTTTGGAARVLAWLERWLQTEWPHLQVYLTTVTEHWATVAVAGPLSRTLLQRVGTDIDLDDDAFPFMSYRPGAVAGIAARVFRISFSGERGYEVNVPAGRAMSLWQALLEAGKPLDVTPYGTEAMHVLRAEKGFIIVGQDTDGSLTPVDLGMGAMVSKSKDFLGRRSLSRSDTRRDDRKQLVGLLGEDPSRVLPEGAQILDAPPTTIPAPMLGHVTSSYASPTLGRAIALAVIKGGRARHGDSVWVVARDQSPMRATITAPAFYDPGNERQRFVVADDHDAPAAARTEPDDAGRAARPDGAIDAHAAASVRAKPAQAVAPVLVGPAHAATPVLVEAPAATSGQAVTAPAVNPLHAHWKRSATILNLRGPAGDADFRQRVEAALGLPLPTTACTTQACAHRRIVWVGPDDWFVIAPADDGGTERALRSALAGQAHALTDVGSGYVVLRLAGEAVRDILAHGCPLDLHPRAFTPGTSAGSHFFKASIWLWRPDDAPAFELLIRRSFANYVSLVLKRCCRECGLAESWSA